MVGAGTLRTERYGRLVRDPELREMRRRGLAEDPLAVVASRSLDLPTDLPLLQDASSRVLVVGPTEGELGLVPARVEYIREGQLGDAFALLRGRHGITTLLCEGGPQLNATLLAAGLVDELFLTTASKLAGGSDALTIVAGRPLEEPAELRLISLHESEGYLFARYALDGSIGNRLARSPSP